MYKLQQKQAGMEIDWNALSETFRTEYEHAADHVFVLTDGLSAYIHERVSPLDDESEAYEKAEMRL